MFPSIIHQFTKFWNNGFRNQIRQNDWLLDVVPAPFYIFHQFLPSPVGLPAAQKKSSMQFGLPSMCGVLKMKDSDESHCRSSVFLVWWSLIIALWRENGNKLTKSRWIYCVSHCSESGSGIDSPLHLFFIDTNSPSFPSVCNLFVFSLSLYPACPLSSLGLPFSGPLLESAWTFNTNNFRIPSLLQLSFSIYTPHLLYWLTWPLRWIPGTFLALWGKKWFAKCHFSCFCSSSQQRETWFSTKVNRALASLWTRST